MKLCLQSKLESRRQPASVRHWHRCWSQLQLLQIWCNRKTASILVKVDILETVFCFVFIWVFVFCVFWFMILWGIRWSLYQWESSVSGAAAGSGCYGSGLKSALPRVLVGSWWGPGGVHASTLGLWCLVLCPAWDWVVDLDQAAGSSPPPNADGSLWYYSVFLSGNSIHNFISLITHVLSLIGGRRWVGAILFLLCFYFVKHFVLHFNSTKSAI